MSNKIQISGPGRRAHLLGAPFYVGLILGQDHLGNNVPKF